MIELWLSSDGKHTVHVSADTPEQLAELAPKAQSLYQQVLENFGTKAQMWQEVFARKDNNLPAGNGNGQPVSANGQQAVGKRIDTPEQAQSVVAPHCPAHQRPMAYRQGRRGAFWSCPTRLPDGAWCPETRDVPASANGHAPTV